MTLRERRATVVMATAVLTLPWFASAQGAAPPAAGAIEMSFLYLPPSQLEPTYHTAIWLEDERGRLVRTLYVSRELSATEYKVGEACPDWVKQSHWEKAARDVVDAVTGPTPSVGSGALRFDLGSLGVSPGTYVFKFQVHITDDYNVLYRGQVSTKQAAGEVAIETLYSSGKPPGAPEFVRDVQVRYVPVGRQ
jgi:hypothetical protein